MAAPDTPCLDRAWRSVRFSSSTSAYSVHVTSSTPAPRTSSSRRSSPAEHRRRDGAEHRQLVLVLSVPDDGFSYADLRLDTATLRPDRALQFRILLGPAPSLHERRRGQIVRSLFATLGRSDFSLALIVGYGLPTFPTRSRPRLVGTAMEISGSWAEGFCAC